MELEGQRRNQYPGLFHDINMGAGDVVGRLLVIGHMGKGPPIEPFGRLGR